jgi:hypothetical protein
VYTASVLEAFDGLVAGHLRDFIELGRMRYSRTPASDTEQRRSLGLQTGTADFEILVWSTGDVEFGYGTVGDNHDEHLNSASEHDLEALIQRLLELARATSP